MGFLKFNGWFKVEDNKVIYHAGIAWSLMNNLRNEKQYNLKNKTFLPEDLLQNAGISASDISNDKCKVLVCKIVEYVVQRIESHVDQVRNLSIKLPQQELINIVLEVNLVNLYLKRIHKRKFDLFHQKSVGVFSVMVQLRLLYYYVRFYILKGSFRSFFSEYMNKTVE